MDPLARAKKLFDYRMQYEALWDTAYRFIAPERQVFFRKEGRSPTEIQESVFDSTAIDLAERLANILLTRLTPPWQRWFRLEPGTAITDPRLKEKLRPLLQKAEKVIFQELSESNLYQELQPLLLDRIIGGTGVLKVEPDYSFGKISISCVPLADVAISDDNSGKITAIAKRSKWSVRDLMVAYADKLPKELSVAQKTDAPEHMVYEAVFKTPDNQWDTFVILDGFSRPVLEHYVSSFPILLASRWTKLPGTPYGRGPGLRALADIRALNKVKELSLKNAIKSVAGAYTVVDDGVLNPYTLAFEPGSFIPVASNDTGNPSIAPFPDSGNFDVSMFQFQELRTSIREVFLADSFGDLSRTPRSATEVAERASIVAQELGATVSRLQFELLTPLLQSVFYYLGAMGKLPMDLSIDGQLLKVSYVSQLARAQEDQDKANLINFLALVGQVGTIDAKAGLVLDAHKALRYLAELDGIPAEVLRTEEEIEGLMEQAAEVQASGVMQPPQEPPNVGGI